MWNRPEFVVKRFIAPYVYNRVLEAFVREPVRTLRVHYSDPVHFKAIWIYIRCHGPKGYAPYSVLTLHHIGLWGKLGADLHIFSIWCQEVECDGVVTVYDWRYDLYRSLSGCADGH